MDIPKVPRSLAAQLSLSRPGRDEEDGTQGGAGVPPPLQPAALGPEQRPCRTEAPDTADQREDHVNKKAGRCQSECAPCAWHRAELLTKPCSSQHPPTQEARTPHSVLGSHAVHQGSACEARPLPHVVQHNSSALFASSSLGTGDGGV